ncbi:MAG: TetR/AcrR family transcriptional regulator, partial [Planctomycetota bacterium]
MPQASKQSRSPRRPPAKTSSAESGHRSAGAAGGEDALADTSDRILEAAGQIFATKGFHRATIREICKAAEANVSAVNYHFGDKRNLYREVFRYALRQADGEHPVPAPPVPGEAPGEATRRVVGALLGRFITAHEGWRGRLIARELADPSEILGEVLESH